MKKQLFSLGFCTLMALVGFAQKSRPVSGNPPALNAIPFTSNVYPGIGKANPGLSGNFAARGSGSQVVPTTTTSTCMLINYPLPATWNLANYVPPAGVDGFVNGLNSDLDREKAMYFDASASANTMMTQVYILFARASTATPTKTVGIRIYDGTTGAPGAQLGGFSIPMSRIIADVNAGDYTLVLFPSPVNLPASKKFFVSVDITGLQYNATVKDTLSIYSNSQGETTPTACWERWSNNAWHSYDDYWGLDASLIMHPALSQAPIVASITTSTNSICAGKSVSYNSTGSTAGTYEWDFGAISTPTAAGATTSATYPTAGTYTTYLVVSDACGAIAIAQQAINVNANPVVTATPSSTTVCSGSSVVLSGSGANTYAWTGGISNGVAFPASSSQNYTVTGTAANGCTNTAVASVVVNSTGPAVTANTTGNSICLGQSVTLTGGGASTYVWTGSVTNGVAFAPPSTQTYTVTGTAGSCTNTAVITISVNPLPTVNANATSTSVCSGSNVTLTGSGTASSYAWTGSVSNGVAFVPISTQTYTVTGTLGTCTSTAAVTVAVTSGPSVTANTTANAICQGQTITLSGSGATSYVWAGGITNGVAFAPTSTQTYTVTGTTGSCTNTAVVTVSVNASPVVSSNQPSAPICSGANVTLSGNGANTYAWTGGISNGVAFSPLASGSYTVTGTAANGCTATAVANITVNPTPNITANATSTAVCPGGQVTLNGSGATSYLWTDGVVDGNAFAPLTTKTYTVTGATGVCTNTAVITVVVNSVPNVTSSPASATSCNGSNVTLTGNGAVSYVWSGGIANGVAFSPPGSGSYTVTGTAANGCTATAVATISVVGSVNVIANASANSVCQGQNVTLSGSGATSYAWTGGVADGVAFTPPSTNTYTVTGTAGACTNTAVVTVTVNSLPSVTANATSTNVCTGSNVTLTGGGATTYTWSSNVTNAIPFSPAASAVYTVTGTSNGCSNTAVVTVVVTTPPTVTAVASSTSICVGNSVTLTGFGATTYTWTNGVTDNVPFTPTSTTTYVVSGTTNGCVGTTTVNIVVNTCTGIEEALVASDAGVIAYPNPNVGDFIIKGTKKATINISNELGQIIEVIELNAGNNFSYNVNHLAQGMYFLSGDAVKQKVIVTK